jgi:transglutaminase-like putative cysteine protease
MQLDAVFRLSTYLTLALASLCLGMTEEPFIPSMMLFLIPIEGLLLLAFALERRWTLTSTASNLIGVVIALGSVLWIISSLMSPANQIIEEAPYPAALLPYGGPVLMVLMLAKLFRPKKLSDYWVLHIIGLMQVALACILASEPVFSLFLIAYLVCALWSLMLFFQYREMYRARRARHLALELVHSDRTRGYAAPLSPLGSPRDSFGSPQLVSDASPVQGADAEREEAPLPDQPIIAGRGWGVGKTLSRALGVVLLGLLLFLIAPRSSNRQWSLLSPSAYGGPMQTGYSSVIDLNSTGALHINDQIALEIFAQDADGKPKLDLDPNQLWRGATLDYHQHGRWEGRRMHRPPFGSRPVLILIRSGSRENLPNLGPGQYYLTFAVDVLRVRGLFLAEPVILAEGGSLLPIVHLDNPASWGPFFRLRDSTLSIPRGSSPRRYRYEQVVLPEDDARPPPPVELSQVSVDQLLQIPPGGQISSWTHAVLERFVEKGRLRNQELATAEDPDLSFRQVLLPANQAKVARTLSGFLAFSGEYTYRLEMRRQDSSLDATEDFLLNVKQGFCEHFATGLALMLRSLGVPCRVVTGYRGVERKLTGEAAAGHYVVRQKQAHAWVEAMIKRPRPDGDSEFYWLTLDPTPTGETLRSHTSSWSQWWWETTSKVQEVWRTLILDYSLDRQIDNLAGYWLWIRDTWETARESVRFLGASPWTWLVSLAAIALSIWFGRRLFTRRLLEPIVSAPVPGTGFYSLWLAVVARHCRLRPEPSQTPLEFAGTVADTFRSVPATNPWGDFPRKVARFFYRIRYGGYSPQSPEMTAIDREVRAVETALDAS